MLEEGRPLTWFFSIGYICSAWQTYRTNVSSGENQRRASDADKGNLPNEHQTKNTAWSDGGDNLQNGAKGGASEPEVDPLRVVAEHGGQHIQWKDRHYTEMYT